MEMYIKTKGKICILATVLCIFLSVILFVGGRFWSREGEDYLQNITIQSEEEGFSAEWLQTAQSEEVTQEEENESIARKNAFAAWREWKEETISGQFGDRNSGGDVIALCGSSHCLLPVGKNLTLSDKEGCIIGSKLAEELFGNFPAEGQKITWRGDTWTVRGVIQEPASLLMVQVGGLSKWAEELQLNRISISLKDGEDRRLTGENFILQNGLSARMLRWDYLHGLSWIWEMVPGEWSDFDGWKRNFQEHEQAVKLANNTAKSSVEAWGLECQKRGEWFAVCGVILLIVGVGLTQRFFTVVYWKEITVQQANILEDID